MNQEHCHNHNDKNIPKEMVYLFYIALTTFAIFVVSFIVFLYTLNLYVGVFALILILSVLIELVLFFRQKRTLPLDELLKLHELKKELLKEKNVLQKQFFKRGISPERFEEESDRIEQDLLNLDYRIQFFDVNGVSQLKEIQDRINLLNKKYMKHEISQNLYEKLNYDLSKQMTYLKEKSKP